MAERKYGRRLIRVGRIGPVWAGSVTIALFVGQLAVGGLAGVAGADPASAPALRAASAMMRSTTIGYPSALADPDLLPVPAVDDVRSRLAVSAPNSIVGGAVAVAPAKRMSMSGSPRFVSAATGSLLFPLDPAVRCAVLNNFGQQRDGYVHVGEDIAAAEGTPVLATVDGTLAKQYLADTSTTQLSGNGWRLGSALDEAYYFYAHLQALNPGLAVGQFVHRGDLLGWVGHTGDAGQGNDHLHFEVHPTGLQAEVADPLLLFDVPTICTVYPPQR